jgi:hypothetical protein
MSRPLSLALVAALLAGVTTASATDPPQAAEPQRSQVERLEQIVERLSTELAAVKAELEALRAQQLEAERLAESERLRQAAAQELAPSDTVDTATTFTSGARMQPQLNPELSATGDIWLVGDGREEAQLRGVELDLQSDLDPYSRMHLVLGFHGDHYGPLLGEADHDEGHEHSAVEVEEAYVTWLNLPGALTLTLGRKRQQFGVLNRWHAHALDQLDLPWALTESFGEEGLSGTGISLDWLMPRLWADANELTVEITNGDNETAFAGEDWDRPTALARLKNYWDLSQDSYLEIGLDAVRGAADPEGDLTNEFYALDATFNWNPMSAALYHDVTVRGMALLSRRELTPGNVREAWSGYLYGQGKLSRRWIAGARFDHIEDQFTPGHHAWGISPYLTYWQSEFVRLRGQLSYRDDNLNGVDRAFALQVTFSAGPHKHESY